MSGSLGLEEGTCLCSPSTGQVGGVAGRPAPTHLPGPSVGRVVRGRGGWGGGDAGVDCLTNLITLVHLAARRKIIPFKFDPIFVFVVITMENRPSSPSAVGLNGK